MIEIFFQSLLSLLIYYSAGNYFSTQILKTNIDKPKDHAIKIIYGYISIGFLSIILNFFIPLSKFYNSIISFIAIFYFIYLFYKSKNKKIILIIFFTISFFSVLTITLDQVNRPDAGLYHLPYTKILNENKIIFGLTNIHFRFGHTSIMQYLNAFNYNYLSGVKGILIPQIIVIITLFYYFFEELKTRIKKGRNNYLTIFLFFSFIFLIINYNRYSSFGNDALANIFYVFILYELLKHLKDKNDKINTLFYLSLLSIFCFFLKPFMIIILFIPLIWLIINKIKISNVIKNKKFYLIIFFLLSFLIKNIITSGCMIYPVKITCFDKLEWYDKDTTQREQLSGEAWAKDWINYANSKQLTQKQYVKNFRWLKTWLENHFQVILKKVLPFIALTSILIFLINLNSKKESDQQINYKIINSIKFITIFTFFSCLFWFLKFPVYRFGSGMIGGFIIILITLYFTKNKIFISTNSKIFHYLPIFLIIIISFKNLNRIYNNYDQKYAEFPWPKIHSFTSDNEKQRFFELKKNNKILFYLSDNGLCMYGPAPCSYYQNKNINLKTINEYKIYYIE